MLDTLPTGPYSTEFCVRLTDENDPVHWHMDYGVAAGILSVVQGKSVADVGGGIGLWSQWWKDRGLDVVCYDGTPDIEHITNGRVSHLDLSVPIPNPPVTRFDWVVCLEVLEHIPQEFEGTAVDNLDRLCKDGIVLSWAVPGQGGFGHCNCRPNEYVIDLFAGRGYQYMPHESSIIRDMTWDVYKDTVMVFRKCSS